MEFVEYQAGAAQTWGKQELPDDLFERLEELGIAADDVAAIRAQGERLTLGVLGLGLAGEAGEVSDEVKKFVGHGHWKEGFDAEKELGDVLYYTATLATALGLDLEAIAVKNAIKLGIRYAQGFSTEASEARVDLDEGAMGSQTLRAIQFRSQPANSLKFTSARELYNFLTLMQGAGAQIHPADDPSVPSRGWIVRPPPDDDLDHVRVEIALADLSNSLDPRSGIRFDYFDGHPVTPASRFRKLAGHIPRGHDSVDPLRFVRGDRVRADFMPTGTIERLHSPDDPALQATVDLWDVTFDVPEDDERRHCIMAGTALTKIEG